MHPLPTVPALSVTPVRGSWRAREARTYLAVAAAGGAGSYVLHSRDIPDDQLFFRSIVWYSVGAAVLCAVHALAVLLVRRFPTARTARLGGRPAVLLRAWRGTWWLTSALDLGLLVVTGSWVHLAWTTAGDRVFMTGLAALPFL